MTAIDAYEGTLAMKRHAPQARDYMTHLPVEVERCESASEAMELMQRRGIHHLPVMNGSRLQGVVTQRTLLDGQLRLGEAFQATPLEELCDSEPITISPVESIDEVVGQMLDRNVDHAVVMDGGFVVGILTVIDVLRFVREHFGGASERN
ncbi:MAG: CBS domain-containing protein [Rubripirellula sp.]